MPNKKFYLLLSLLIFLLTSLFFSRQYVLSQIIFGEVNNQYYDYADLLQLSGTLNQKLHENAIGSEPWLNMARFLAKKEGEVALKLAKFYLDNSQEKEAVLWFQQAVRLKNNAARLPLANLYLTKNLSFKANSVLNRGRSELTSYSINELKLLIEIAIIQGNDSDIQYFSKLLVNQDKKASILRSLQKYQIIVDVQNTPIVNNIVKFKKSNCIAHIQPFATSLEELDYLENFLSSLPKHKLSHYVCFDMPRYISQKKLACSHEIGQRIDCQEHIWQEYSARIDAKYLLILAPEGNANIKNGIMYLDENDDANVFYHELAHILGFIDEYPLPQNHQVCFQSQDKKFAHNIAVLSEFYQGDKEKIDKLIREELPWGDLLENEMELLKKSEHGWQLNLSNTGNEIGVFLSETCAGRNVVAVKPLNMQSQLRYFEKPFPELYLKMFKRNPTAFLMPSFQKNISQSNQ